jgi:uncharacterized membrane protein YeaQ/YmgE (transglycosylase-associated protein family)
MSRWQHHTVGTSALTLISGKEDKMFTLHLMLADGVTIHLGDNVWTFSTNFLVYLIVAAIVGFVAESLVGWRLPFGFVGAIIAALVGIWLLTNVIILTGIGDINVYGVPILRALVGAIILVAIWHLLTFSLWHSRSRDSYRRGQ